MRTASRRPTRNGDGDDWFAEAPASAPHTPASDDPETLEDDWLRERRRSRPGRPRRDLPPVLRSPRAAMVVAGLVIVLAIGLYVGGVFNSSKSTPPPPTIPSTTVAPATTAPTVPSVIVPRTTLKPGDTGAQVKVLQHVLAVLGDSPGKIDGDYGPGTQAAVERFQRAHKLTPDGIFGPATRRALVRAVQAL